MAAHTEFLCGTVQLEWQEDCGAAGRRKLEDETRGGPIVLGTNAAAGTVSP